MPLPPHITPGKLKAGITNVEQRAEEFVSLYYEQPNLFSGVIGVFGTLALDALTPYEKNPNRHEAATRFPDLILRGATRPLNPQQCLECKASKRPWSVDSHYDHAGWHIVWRYLVDPMKLLGRQVVIWRVDCAFLTKADWKYGASKAGKKGGGRTHTFSVTRPSEVFADAPFEHPYVRVIKGKPMVDPELIP